MELNWSNEQPTKPGAYWVRGFSLDRPNQAALVAVEKHDGELWSNLHVDTAARYGGFNDWSAIADHSASFEWCGPLLPPNNQIQRAP